MSSETSSTSSIVYQRVLLKLSGEALCPRKGFGIDAESLRRIAAEIKSVQDAEYFWAGGVWN